MNRLSLFVCSAMVFLLTEICQGQLNGANSGLVGYWKLNELTGTNAYDSSGLGHHGYLVNSPLWITGRIGGALSFNGVNTVVRIPSSTDFDFVSDYSISAWVYSKTNTRLSAVSRAMGNLWELWTLEEITESRFDTEFVHQIYPPTDPLTKEAYRALGSGIGYTTGAWHHVVGVKSGDKLKIYVDSLAGTDSQSITTGQYNPNLVGVDLAIGARRATTPDANWNGYVDEVRIYNRALSGTEITNLYYSVDLEGTNLVAWWKFDESSGTNVYDSSISSNHTGILMGSQTRVSGISGGGIYFNGITDYIRIPQSDDLFLGTKTVACWAKVENFDLKYEPFFGWGRATSNRVDNYHCWINSNGGIGASYLNGAGDEIIRDGILAPSGTIKLGQWAHYAIVYSGDTNTLTMSFYRNGVLAGTPFTTTNGISDHQAMTSIGSQEDMPNPAYVRVFSGIMDDYRVYNKALSSNEVSALYYQLYSPSSDTNKPTTPSNLVATAISHWQVNLSWSPSSDSGGVAGYLIYRDGTVIDSVTSTNFQDVEHTPTSTMYNSARAMLPNTAYSYTVAAYDYSYNISTQSTSAVATTLADPGGPLYTLTVVRYGSPNASWAVTSLPAGMNCPTVCTYQFTNGVSLQISPYPFIGGMSAIPPAFNAWSGDLSGNAQGFLRMTNNKTIYAYYNDSWPTNSSRARKTKLRFIIK